MILEGKKKAKPLHAPRYRPGAFQALKISPQMQVVVARCTTPKPKQGDPR